MLLGRVPTADGRPPDEVGACCGSIAGRALCWAAMRRDGSEIAVAGVVGSVAYNATASLGVAALVRPITSTGLLAPAIAAAILPLALSSRRAAG
jgi:Ca2+/Na+ antiporter